MQNFFSISFVPISVRVFIFYLLICYILDLLLYFLKYQYSIYLYDKESHPVICAKNTFEGFIFLFAFKLMCFLLHRIFFKMCIQQSLILFFHSHNNSGLYVYMVYKIHFLLLTSRGTLIKSLIF